MEDDNLPVDRDRHPLPGAARRVQPAGGQPRRRQREAPRGNCVAAFLGDPNHSVGADSDLLHGSRTRASDRQGQGTASLLRAATATSIVSTRDSNGPATNASIDGEAGKRTIETAR